MQIIWAQNEDAAALAQVFYDAVRCGPSPYTDAQRAAWAPHPPDADAFAKRLSPQQVAVATSKGKIVGFMTLDKTGYIDLAFVLYKFRGMGAFRAMYALIESRAVEWHIARLSTHASLSAQPAFQAVGFSVIQQETVTRAGETLHRAEMEKHLT